MKRILLIVLILMLLAGGATGWFWYSQRQSKLSGPNYDGELAALAPRDTAIFLSIDDWSGMLERLSKTKSYAEITAADWSLVLQSDEEWREAQGTDGAIARRLTEELTDRVNRRWLGKQTIYMEFPQKGADAMARALLANTNAGIEENLAQAVAESNVPLEHEQTVEAGVRLSRYKAKDEDDSFAYTRFGPTAALSLGSSAFEPLRRLDELRAAAKNAKAGDGAGGDSILSEDAFASWFEKQGERQGAYLYVDTQAAFSIYRDDPKMKIEEKERRRANFEFARDRLGPLERVFGRIALQDEPLGIAAEFTWPKKGSRDLDAPAPKIAANRIPSLLPETTLLLASGRSERMGDLLREITYGYPKGGEPRNEAEKWEKELMKLTGVSVEKELLPLLQGELGAAWLNTTPGAVGPDFRTVALGQTSDPEAMRRLMAKAYAFFKEHSPEVAPAYSLMVKERTGPDGKPLYVFNFPAIATLEFGMVDDFVALGMQPGTIGSIQAMARDDSTTPTLARSEAWRRAGFEPAQPYRFLAFGNFDRAARVVKSANALSLLWQKDARKAMREFQDTLELLRPIDVARISREESRDSADAPAKIDAFVPLH